ncbi:MAG: PAS domain-containing protein [Deltaproteobacteria bacterium]|nr:PAS domain-containing protein [Deltaproteobacteria bacterium]
MPATAARVLVITADAAELARVRGLLGAVGEPPLVVEGCGDAGAARAALAGRAYDLYLLRDRLGDADGLALLREAGMSGERPVLVLAGADDEASDRAAQRAGAAGYLVLDELTAPGLARTVRYALNRPRRAGGRGVTARLRESEQRLELAVEAASLGMWDWDLAHGELYYSPQWKAMVGHSDATLPTSTSTWESLLHPDDLPRCVARLRDFVRSPSGTYDDEFRLRHRDGSYRWIQSRAAFVRDARGRAQRMIGMHVDVTERREAEEAIRRLNGELEQRVADRTAQLEAANRELETFAYSVSHDLRAPLRSIDGFVHALQEECADGGLSAQGLHYLDRVRAAAQRLGGLIDDLLALARVARSEMRRTPVDLSALAGEIAAELSRGEPQRRVEVDVAAGLTARGDPVLLRLALENLLGNAWKYTSKRPQAHIAVGMARDNGERVFFVRDDGAGFDPADAHRLFGPFQRLHSPSEFEGSGIGLATVQRIVHRHGGRVWAEGRPNAGATFYFTL